MLSPRALAYKLADTRLAFAALKFERMLQKYSPTQPRVPSGNPDGGQWTSGGQSDGSQDMLQQLASVGGDLYAELRYPSGSYCVYSYGGYLRMIPGPVNLGCPPWMPFGGTSHGMSLNDNYLRKAI